MRQSVTLSVTDHDSSDCCGGEPSCTDHTTGPVQNVVVVSSVVKIVQYNSSIEGPLYVCLGASVTLTADSGGLLYPNNNPVWSFVSKPSGSAPTITPFLGLTHVTVGNLTIPGVYTVKAKCGVDDPGDTFTIIAWKWLSGPSIQVGEISQTFPLPTEPYRRNLHYGGTGNPESASFQIDVSSASDYDCKSYDDSIRENAGLDSTSTDWTCVPAAAGVISDGGYYSEFVPGNGIYSDIQIKCKVYEGHIYSYLDGDFDSPVEKTWNHTLTTFKVGVSMNPGNINFWEDDADSVKSYNLHGSISGLACSVPWTSLVGQPGQVQSSGDLDAKSVTWTAKAATDTGLLNGIMGSISYSPFIHACGILKIHGSKAGLSTGTLSALGSIVMAGSSPYVSALCNCVIQTLGTNTHYVYSLLGSSAIENINDRTIQTEDSSEGITQAFLVDLSGLSINGSMSSEVGVALHGSIDFDSLSTVQDNSSTSNAYVKIVDDQPGCEPGYTEYGTARPVYTGQ